MCAWNKGNHCPNFPANYLHREEIFSPPSDKGTPINTCSLRTHTHTRTHTLQGLRKFIFLVWPDISETMGNAGIETITCCKISLWLEKKHPVRSCSVSCLMLQQPICTYIPSLPSLSLLCNPFLQFSHHFHSLERLKQFSTHITSSYVITLRLLCSSSFYQTYFYSHTFLPHTFLYMELHRTTAFDRQLKIILISF